MGPGGTLRRVRSLADRDLCPGRIPRCGLEHGRRRVLGRPREDALPLHGGNADGPRFQACQDKEGFPALVWLGASENNLGEKTRAACSFLGDLSYPLYMVHYPLFYLYYSYIGFDGNGVAMTFSEAWPAAVIVVIASIALAWICMKFYDIPLRLKINS